LCEAIFGSLLSIDERLHAFRMLPNGFAESPVCEVDLRLNPPHFREGFITPSQQSAEPLPFAADVHELLKRGIIHAGERDSLHDHGHRNVFTFGDGFRESGSVAHATGTVFTNCIE
jgi:hypothetical protein